MDAEHVDLVVIDRLLDDGAGLALAREVRLRHPHARTVLALDDESAGARDAALAAGAVGCLTPGGTRETVTALLADALRGADRDEAGVGRPPAGDALTDRERVVLRLMRQRLTDKEIAQRLGVSWHTVRTHAQSILRKSGVHSRRDLDAWGAGPEGATHGATPT